MKLNKKNLGHLFSILFLSALIGTLLWMTIEQIIRIAGSDFSLQTGKIGFDLQMISFFININPGTFLGLIPGGILFYKI